MNNFKNIAKSLATMIGTSRLISKKNVLLTNSAKLCIGLFCLFSVTIFSCTKENSSSSKASLMIVQGTNSNISNDIFLDNASVGNQPLSYGAHTDYLNSFYGNHIVQMSIHGPGSLTYVGLASDTVLLNAANNYSLFLWSNSTANTDNYPGTRINDQIGFTLVIDSLSQPAAGQAKIRFVNVSLNAGFADLVTNGNVLVSNKATGGYSQFIPVNPTTSSNFEVRENGSSVVLSTLKNIEIKSGGVYTIWLYGLASDSQGTGLNLGIITNKQY